MIPVEPPPSEDHRHGEFPRAHAGLPWLLADIGGTNARFGWVDQASQDVRHHRNVPVAGFTDPVSAILAYLADVSAALGARYRAPRRAAIAVATAPRGDVVELTNSRWRFKRSALAAELELERLLVINDLEALAWSLPQLGPSQIRAHGLPIPVTGPLAVVGPGTGLGVAGIVPWRSGWVPVSGEGGHATLAPVDDFEAAVLDRVRARLDHVSAERLLSGIGLPLLHDAIAEVLGITVASVTTEELIQRGLAGSDPTCDRTLDVFCAMLGGFAGNVALTLGARGGVFIGGGIVPRLGDRFFASAFRERFEAKGRFRSYLQAIPTAVITDTLVALAGAAAALEQYEG